MKNCNFIVFCFSFPPEWLFHGLNVAFFEKSLSSCLENVFNYLLID